MTSMSLVNVDTVIVRLFELKAVPYVVKEHTLGQCGSVWIAMGQFTMGQDR